MPVLIFNSTESLPMDLDIKEKSKPQYRNETTEFSTTKTEFVSTNVLIIVLLTMATMFLMALCAFCYSCFLRKRVTRRKSMGDEPNAPSRQQLQAVFENQRMAMLEPHRKSANLDFSIFQSESSFRASLSRWASVKNLPTLHSSEYPALKKEKQPSHYATTPRSVFSALPRKWSENSAKRIEHLRTKLIARFPSSSSQSTSDISVFFSTSSHNSDWGECSQVGPDEEKEAFKSQSEAGKSRSKSNSFSKRVPSIVIEFVE